MLNTIARPLLSLISLAAINDPEWLDELGLDVGEDSFGRRGLGLNIEVFDRRTGRLVSELDATAARFLLGVIEDRDEMNVTTCPRHRPTRRRGDSTECTCAHNFRSNLVKALALVARNAAAIR